MYVDYLFQRVVSIVVTCGIVLAAGVPTSGKICKQSKEVKDFLQTYLSTPRIAQDRTARFSCALVSDTHDSGEEWIVYVTGKDWCGSGGCTLLVLRPDRGSFDVIGRITSVRLPVRVLASQSNGRSDLGVWVEGGGIRPGYEAKLRFDGKQYPKNPTVVPGTPNKTTSAGMVIIARDETGERVFE